jgi:dTDP-4-dehydrorhamnose 3,5-epimerase
MDFLQTTAIDGVLIANLRAFGDERGRFMETFRMEWFPQVDWTKTQMNRSDSRANVLRGLHYHFHQIDYWYVPVGRIRAGLADLRPSSPTYKTSLTVEMGGDNNIGLFIPIGVAHGFYALTDCTLFYTVNNYYNGGKDEFGVAWDDPTLGVAWGAESPLLSERDKTNPRLDAINPNAMPK